MLLFDGYFELIYAGIMKNELKELYTYLDKRFLEIDEQFKEVHRRINVLIDHVDGKNDEQDERLDGHDLRVPILESDFQVLTS
jgi:hypothetical protein